MDTKTQVEQLLKNYNEIKRSLDVLKFEIEQFTGTSYNEVIEGLNFAKPESERVHNTNVSDKTARISLIYRDFVDIQNEEALRGLVRQYYILKSELKMLEYCISKLPQRLSEIITDMFVVRLSWAELCNKYYVSIAMIGKYRKKGIAEICKMYDLRIKKTKV